MIGNGSCGCAKDCLRNLSADAVYRLRETYAALGSEHNRLQYIVQQLLAMRNLSSLSLLAFKYQWFGIDMCSVAWRMVLDVSKGKVEKAMHMINDGIFTPPQHGNLFQLRDTPAKMEIYGFLNLYRENSCDPIPFKKGIIYQMAEPLPDEDVYADFQVHVKLDHAHVPLPYPVPSFAVFQEVRRDYFANMQPANSKLPRCDTCAALRAFRFRADPEARPALMKQWIAHGQEHRTERQYLQTRIEAAIQAGNELVIQIDYTDPIKLPQILPGPPKVHLCVRPLVVGLMIAMCHALTGNCA
jgi:hypothetical protein